MRIGKYEIVSELGEGGMGKVYKARDTAFQDGYVALKVLNAEYSKNEEMRKRFFDEAQKARRMSSPHVVKVFDYGSADGLLYIAMEYIEGEDLGKRLKRAGTIAPDEAVRIAMEVAIALEESHEKRVVHRDVKPGNIMIDKTGHVYVTDFGIAKTVGSLSQTSHMGTPLYMSPEHHLGKPVDQRSDLYSLGIVMYEMLTGDVPFHAETPSTIGLLHISQAPEPPRSRNGQIHGWLNSVVMRLLAKNPDSRFQSCGELVGALRERITVTIPRPPMSATSRKWLLIGLQGVAAVIVGVAVVMWYDKPNPVPPPLISAEERREKAEDWVSKAKEYEKINEYIEAKHAYSKALKDEPENREAKAGSERCKEILDKESKRIGEEKARKDEAVSYVAKGRESEKTGNYAKAKDAYSKALEQEPGNSEATEGIKRCESKQADAKQIKESVSTQAVATNYTEHVAGVEMEFVMVKGGEYEMGCGSWTGGCDDDEKPVHTVTLSGFYIGRCEVTQGQWRKVMGGVNPSRFKECGDDCPVEQVNCEDVEKFIKELNRITGNKYRLPTEAEWEYAARSGGKGEKYAGTSDDGNLKNYAWYGGNADGKTHKVGLLNPNGLGICDMSGNVWEWVADMHGAYSSASVKNPKNESGSDRVIRGGSWSYEPRDVRAAYRLSYPPSRRLDRVGFRLARTL